MCASSVIIEISFNVKKDKSRFPIPDNDVIRFTGMDFLDDELVGGRFQRCGQSYGVFRYEPHRAERGTTQYIIKYKNREKRIGSHFEMKCVQFRFVRRRADSIKPVQIEVHRGASARDDHLFKSSGRLIRAFLLNLCCRIFRAIAEKQKQWEHEITQDCLKHCPIPPDFVAFWMSSYLDCPEKYSTFFNFPPKASLLG